MALFKKKNQLFKRLHVLILLISYELDSTRQWTYDQDKWRWDQSQISGNKVWVFWPETLNLVNEVLSPIAPNILVSLDSLFYAEVLEHLVEIWRCGHLETSLSVQNVGIIVKKQCQMTLTQWHQTSRNGSRTRHRKLVFSHTSTNWKVIDEVLSSSEVWSQVNKVMSGCVLPTSTRLTPEGVSRQVVHVVWIFSCSSAD